MYKLQPQKCKIIKEVTNEIRQTLNLHTNMDPRHLDLNKDSIKIRDIEIKPKDLTQRYTRGNLNDHKILTQSLKSHDIWNARWHSIKNKKGEPEAVQTKVWIPNVISRPDLLNLGRITLGSIIQFITGHNHLLRHKRYYLINPELDLTCRLCGTVGSKEDSIHIWSRCPNSLIRAVRNKAIALCRLKLKQAPNSKARAKLSFTLIDFNLPT